MKLSPHLHQQIRIKNTLTTFGLVCLVSAFAWLSTRYYWQADISANANNTLSFASQQLLKSLEGKIEVKAYIKTGQPVRSQIAQLIARYRQHKEDLTLTIVDPVAVPDKARQMAISDSGLIVVRYRGREEKINYLDESSLSNALLQLAHAEERWVSFLAGHGERSPEGQANFDLSVFCQELTRRKINSRQINLVDVSAIPDNSALLVISAPAVPLLAGEQAIISDYLRSGGNLLILSEPGDQHLTLLKTLGLKQLPGVLVEPNAKLYGINDTSFLVVSSYFEHPLSQDFQTLTLYPAVAAFELDDESEFQAHALFSSSEQSWTETGETQGKVSFDADRNEKQGPLVLAYALTRTINGKAEQRIVVVGDGDFLSNAYVGNVGNRDMGLRLINWLIHDDRFIEIPAKKAVDATLQLSKSSVAIIGFGFLIILPCLLLGSGLIIWHKRKQR